MALFVLLLVGIVVAQTWVDWRDTRQGSPIPDWAKGMAMAGVIAITLASAVTYATVWIEGSDRTSPAGAQLLLPEIGFLLCAMGAIVVAFHKKRRRWLFVLAGIVAAAFWAGITLAR